MKVRGDSNSISIIENTLIKWGNPMILNKEKINAKEESF